jgi:hypothetical protein
LCVTTDSLVPERYRLSIQNCSSYNTVQLINRSGINLDSSLTLLIQQDALYERKRGTITKPSWFWKKKFMARLLLIK